MNTNYELSKQLPWLHAESESWWDVTGTVSEHHSFTNCIAQVVPAYITGMDDGAALALFRVYVWGGAPLLVDASRIVHAKRLVFVLADDGRTAYYLHEQEFVARETQ